MTIITGDPILHTLNINVIMKRWDRDVIFAIYIYICIHTHIKVVEMILLHMNLHMKQSLTIVSITVVLIHQARGNAFTTYKTILHISITLEVTLSLAAL